MSRSCAGVIDAHWTNGGVVRSIRSGWRLAALSAALMGTVFLGARWLGGYETALFSLYERWGAVALVAASIVLIVLLSVPFLPGFELGWALMMIAGLSGVAVVYGAALVALSLSFLVGRHIPLPHVARALEWLRLFRIAAWVAELAPLPPDAQLDRLLRTAPARWVPFLVRHRYLTIAIVLNMPGNSLLGGGGGIALLAGLSRQFTYRRYLLTVSLAVLPVPLLFLINHVLLAG